MIRSLPSPPRSRAACPLVACCALPLLLWACDRQDPIGPDPNAPVLLFASGWDRAARIHVLRADGSHGPLLTSPSGQDMPAVSPDGQWIAYRRIAATDGSIQEAGLYIMRVDGTEARKLFEPVIEDCDHSECVTRYYGQPRSARWSPNGGRLAFMSWHEGFFFIDSLGHGHAYNPYRIYTINPDGSGLAATNPVVDTLTLPDWYPDWSPDGTRIVFASGRAAAGYRDPALNSDIYVMNHDGSDVLRLTDSPLDEIFPTWSSDGGRIAFSRYAGSPNKYDIWVMNADGSDALLLVGDAGMNFHPAWSPDGTRIAFTRISNYGRTDENWDIYMANADGTGLTRVTDGPEAERGPSWLPQP